MPAVAAAAAIVGAGIAIYGQIKSAQDQAQMDQDRAAIAKQQSDEIGARAIANEQIRDQQAQHQKLAFASAFAASGKAGVGVGSQLEIQNRTDLNSMMAAREARFQMTMLQEQAGIDTSLADQTKAAGTLNAIGTGLRGVGGAASMATSGGSNPGYGGTQSLGAYPAASAPSNSGSGMGAGAYGGG